MMKYRNQISNGFFNVLLFSGLGCFSLFFLVRYTDIPLNSQDILMTPKVYLAVSIIFTGVGLSLLYLSRKIRNAHPSLFRNRKKLILSSVITAVILFASKLFVISYCKMDCRNGTSIRTPMAWCTNAGHHLDDRTAREWSVNDQ